MHVKQALELVKAEPGCMEVLTVGLLPTEGDQDPVPVEPPADPTMVQAVDHSSHVEGDIPPRIFRKEISLPICHWPWVSRIRKHIAG